jgi:hypothetical protein
MRWIETDTGTNVDISSATAVGAYTANADRLIICDVSIDAVAGAGDYVMYITRQIGGSGSAYVILPKSTLTAATGETAISGQSGFITVRNGDVLTCYIDGLAGDTATPDWTTRWYELAALKPATADRTINVDADGLVTLAPDSITASVFDESTAFPIKSADTGATQIARVGADSDTLETLSDQMDAIDSDVWSYSSRTLTQSAASVAAVLAGSDITIQRGDTETISLTNIGALTGYTKLWFTVKARKSQADSASLLQIEIAGGLLYLNGAAASTATDGSITISDQATGDISIVIKAAATAVLEPGTYFYDVQMLTASGVTTLTDGSFTVEGDVTRAVA